MDSIFYKVKKTQKNMDLIFLTLRSSKSMNSIFASFKKLKKHGVNFFQASKLYPSYKYNPILTESPILWNSFQFLFTLK